MNSKNTMTVTDFIEKWDSAIDCRERTNLLKSVVKKSYVPIIEKRTMIQLAVDKATVANQNGLKYIDMFVLRFNFYLIFIPLYTTLHFFDTKENNVETKDTLKIYDLFQSRGIWDVLFEILGEAETQEMTTIQKNILDTFHNRESTMEAAIYKVGDLIGRKIGVAAGYAIENLNKVSQNKDLINKIINFKPSTK